MLAIRKAEERGPTNLGWLKSWHSFSFGRYYDPKFMGFESLRVINDDHVAPDRGFDAHPHDNMEIITYILEGQLEHKDSLGTGSVIKPGDVQRMSAGTGITHSEFNPSRRESVHLLQIWILPKKRDVPPSYDQKYFAPEQKRGKLLLVASETGRDGSISINQDADMYAGLIDGDETVTHQLKPGRKAWIQVARGSVHVNGNLLYPGDGVAVSEEEIKLHDGGDAEVLLFDLAPYAANGN